MSKCDGAASASAGPARPDTTKMATRASSLGITGTITPRRHGRCGTRADLGGLDAAPALDPGATALQSRAEPLTPVELDGPPPLGEARPHRAPLAQPGEAAAQRGE